MRYTELVYTKDAVGQDRTPLLSLFQSSVDDRILLSVHLLGKPSSAQLFRLHSDIVSTDRQMRTITARLSRKPDEKLARIKPFDIAKPILSLPYVFLDTWASRRHLEKTFGIPFRRPPVLPSRDWRFLRHDVELVDDKIAFELTAKRHAIPFGHQAHFDADGAPYYPRVTVTDGSLTHTLQPRPDATLIVGNHHIIVEHDCGEETVTLGNIIRDATIARKQLVYDQLERSGTLDNLGWGRRIYAYVVDSTKRTQVSARKRVKRCVETLPVSVNPHRFYFVDRHSFIAAGDDISDLQWVRGDGTVRALPCW